MYSTGTTPCSFTEVQKQVNPDQPGYCEWIVLWGRDFYTKVWDGALALAWLVALVDLSDLMNINEPGENHIHHSPF